MTKEELLLKANDFNVSPSDRLCNKVKNILNNPDTIIDTHCHIFDSDSTPLGAYVNKRIGDIPEFILTYYKKDIEDFYDILFMKSMHEILEHYYANYYEVEKTILVPLMMDLDKGWEGKHSPKTVKAQIMEVKELMIDYPIIPFFSVDPRRTDVSNPDNELYSNFYRAFEGPNRFFGIKVYPSLGYLPYDERLDPIYEICNKYDIPITSHCGSSLIRGKFPEKEVVRKKVVNDKIVEDKFSFYINDRKKGEADIAREFNHPKQWEPVLWKYEKLKINIAHYGGRHAWDAFFKKNDTKPNRVTTINKLATVYNGRVFSDVSSTFTKRQTFKNICKQFNDHSIIEDILMYGSDIHVTLPTTNFDKELAKFKKYAGEDGFKKFSHTTPRKFLGI
jgi:predicted TIM-barrel fold metal-dependent hydrolase